MSNRQGLTNPEALNLKLPPGMEDLQEFWRAFWASSIKSHTYKRDTVLSCTAIMKES